MDWPSSHWKMKHRSMDETDTIDFATALPFPGHRPAFTRIKFFVFERWGSLDILNGYLQTNEALL